MKVHIVPILRDNYCYLLEGKNSECIILDPGQTKPVELAISQHNLKPVMILNTHHHADHVAGNHDLKKLYGIPVVAPKSELPMIPHSDKGVIEGDIIEQSGISLKVIETPGHTNGHVVFHAEGNLFSGDTLFSIGCGRLLEGSPNDMWSSLQRLKELPPETNIYCGHEYTESNGIFAIDAFPANQDIRQRLDVVKKLRLNNLPTIPVTLETELKTNPFLLARTAEEFADLRKRKDSF